MPGVISRRIRVLTVARDAGSGYGGAEKVAYEFARRLDPQQFASYLCTTHEVVPSRRASVAEDRRTLGGVGIPVLALDRHTSRELLAWRRLYWLMVRERIDIVHAHMPRASVPAAILGRLARVPVIISHEHGSALDGKLARRVLDRHVVARLSTLVLAVSEWDRRNIVEREGIPPELVRVLPNGIAAPEPVPGGLREDLSGGRSLPIVGAVGRLVPEKGHADLLDAVARLRATDQRVHCVLVGDGPQDAALRAQAERLGIAGSVSFLGRREDVPAVLASLDVAVLPSRREGSPLAMLEYMGAGAPIVASRVGGIPELVEDGRQGLLVAPADPAALAAAIARLVGDSALAARLGAAARRRQRERYSLDAVVPQLERLYRKLLLAQ